MARRVVTGVFRGSRVQTNALGNTNETWSPAPVNEVVADIVGNTHTYVVVVPGPDGRPRSTTVLVTERPGAAATSS